MSNEIPEAVKEEIRSLRKEGHEIKDIYHHMKGTCSALTEKRCQSIAAWVSPNLERKRRNRIRTFPGWGTSPEPDSPEVAQERREKEYILREKLIAAMKPAQERASEASPLKKEAVAQSSEEPWAKNEGQLISKAEAIEMLSQHYDPGKIAGYFKGFTEPQLLALHHHLEKGVYAKNPALLEDNGKRGNGGHRPIRKKEDFMPFIEKNEIARDMSLLALALGPDGGQIEEALMELYQGKFKNRDELHDLLKESKDDIARLIQDGVTNLGAFLGGYSLLDRRMAPIILGGVANQLPLEKVTPSIENILLRVANGLYDPAFNRNTSGTIADLEKKASQGAGFAQKIYIALVSKYQEALKRQDELNRIAEQWRVEHAEIVDGKGFAM